MNEMAHTLARDQVGFLEKQVSQLAQEAIKARRAVLSYQHRNGMVSPQATTETISTIVAKLEAQRTSLETRLSALQSYMVPTPPHLVDIKKQTAAEHHKMDQKRDTQNYHYG